MRHKDQASKHYCRLLPGTDLNPVCITHIGGGGSRRAEQSIRIWSGLPSLVRARRTRGDRSDSSFAADICRVERLPCRKATAVVASIFKQTRAASVGGARSCPCRFRNAPHCNRVGLPARNACRRSPVWRQDKARKCLSLWAFSHAGVGFRLAVWRDARCSMSSLQPSAALLSRATSQFHMLKNLSSVHNVYS